MIFFITSIDNEIPTDKGFWVICLNVVPLTVGGCQQKVKKDDRVLFAYATENVTKHYLKLSGPALVNLISRTRQSTGTMHAKREVSITFKKLGIHKLKVEKKLDSVRSNQLVIDVVIEGSS